MNPQISIRPVLFVAEENKNAVITSRLNLFPRYC